MRRVLLARALFVLFCLSLFHCGAFYLFFGPKEKREKNVKDVFFCNDHNNNIISNDITKKRRIMMGGKKPSGAAKRKKKKEKEDAIERKREETERLKLGPTALWTGLVLHHKDIFASHVMPKLNGADRYFFSEANSDGENLREYAGVDVSEIVRFAVRECSSISTLEFVWNNLEWGEKLDDGNVKDQARFCWQVALTNKLELLKWTREVKKCEWDEQTITAAANVGNLEMLKYCFANDCPCDERESCVQAAIEGNLDCLRFLLEKLKPSREVERSATIQAAAYGHLDILKYCIEERKVTESLEDCVGFASQRGELITLKYLVEEAKAPLDNVDFVSAARFREHYECENYLLEKGVPEPTDQEYEDYVRLVNWQRRRRGLD